MTNGHDLEFEELAAGFALDALDRADEERFREHLSGCDTCPRLVAEFRAVAAVLADSLDEVSASPAVKEGLLAQVRGEQDRRAQASESPPISPIARRPRRRVSWPLPLAASLLLVLGLGAWNLQLQRELASARADQATQAQLAAALQAGGRAWGMAPTADSPGASGVVVYDPRSGQLILHAEGLPPLRENQAYEAWVLRGDAMAPAGLTSKDAPSRISVPLDAQLDQIGAVALSLEPASGSATPTGPVLLIAKL